MNQSPGQASSPSNSQPPFNSNPPSNSHPEERHQPLVLALEAAGLEAIAAVGGKNASLGELLRELATEGVRVPGGFATTAYAYGAFLDANQLRQPLGGLLAGLDGNDLAALQAAGRAARALVLAARLPEDLEQAILRAYRSLGQASAGGGQASGVAVAVRSSATAEDLPEASFAGQQETFLNVAGEAEAGGRLPALLRLPVHRSGDLLPDLAWLRPPGGGPLDRGATHGAL